MVQPDAVVVANLLRESMADGKIPFLTVTSNSMSPLLRQGDQVGLHPTAPDQLVPGDVIVFRNGNTFMTHRFLGTRHADGQTWLLTHGDRPLTPDPPSPPDAYVGRVVLLRRNRRTLSLDEGPGSWLNRQLGRLARVETTLFSAGDSSRWARWPRRALYALAILLTSVCEQIGGRQRQDASSPDKLHNVPEHGDRV